MNIPMISIIASILIGIFAYLIGDYDMGITFLIWALFILVFNTVNSLVADISKYQMLSGNIRKNTVYARMFVMLFIGASAFLYFLFNIFSKLSKY